MVSAPFLALPEELRREAEAVEEAIGGNITTQPMGADVEQMLGRGDLAAMDCGIVRGRAYATVHVPRSGVIDVRTLGHEIMHAHRNLVEQVWQLQGASGLSKIPAFIENDLEHLVIVRREIELFSDAKAAWESDFRRNISGLVQQSRRNDLSAGDTLNLRFSMLRAWLVTTQLTPGLAESDELMAELDRRGFRRDTANIISSYRKVAGDKEAAAAMMVRFAKLDPDKFALMRFRPQQGAVERKALPAR